jgi:hypothetical protein
VWPGFAHPDLPKRWSERVLNHFDPTILGRVANIKDGELAM